MIPVTTFAGQKVAIFGLGISGLATASALFAGGADVIGWDDNYERIEYAASAGIPTADLRRVDRSRIALAYRVASWGRSLPARADDGERRLFSGETADIVDDLRAFRDFGVGWVDFGFEGATAEAMIASLRRFRDDVLARV